MYKIKKVMKIFIIVLGVILTVGTASVVYYFSYYRPELKKALEELNIDEQESMEKIRKANEMVKKEKCYKDAEYTVDEVRVICDEQYKACNIYFDPSNDCSVYINLGEGYCIAKDIIEGFELTKKLDRERCMVLYGPE